MVTALLLGLVAVCAFGVVLNWYFKNYHRQVMLALRMNGPMAYPLIGNINMIKPAQSALIRIISFNVESNSTSLSSNRNDGIESSEDIWWNSTWLAAIFSTFHSS